ncbi:uncharacterized protein LOC111903462 isoform X2 [Lactuca sativa]|uniref:uncharacterized protein LOC111903462 isoform X2 n=1 Tax=Lactuca sativa TaxID=4236 RepID=UPI000CD9C7D6|nr:uncharacterized protein LOC111903462 isoform X2 [Lactuca sativa]
MVNPHFDDTIKVIGVDADGKKYDKVSRIEARGEETDIHIVLDVNSQLYPMHAGEKYRMVLSQTLNEDGSTVTTHTQLFTTPKGEHLGYILCSTKKGRTRLACDILFEKDVNALLFIVAKNSL